MTHQIIDAKKAAHKIVVSCKLMGVSPSGYFACKKRGCERRRPCRDRVALAHLRERFSPSGETARRNRIARLMRENDLKAHQKRRFKKTTDSAHKGRIAPNLLAQDFSADGPDQKWASDISYVWTAEGWLYLALVLDLFSRRIIGFAMSSRMKKGLAIAALRKALMIRQSGKGLIHHSDRGSQGGFNRSSQRPLGR